MKTVIEMAREAGLLYHIPFPSDSHVAVALHRFANLVRADERAEMRKGYAGVELWVGDAVVTQLVSQSVIENEIRRGLALEYAAYKCLAMYREARGNT